MKKILFVVFFIFLVWAIIYGENLPVSTDTFSEWISGKVVLGVIIGLFLAGLILSVFSHKGEVEEKKPMATKK